MSRVPLNKVSYQYGIQVKREHLDALDHVNNIVYIEWMEVGRIKLLETIGYPAEELEKSDIYPVLRSTEIYYKNHKKHKKARKTETFNRLKLI